MGPRRTLITPHRAGLIVLTFCLWAGASKARAHELHLADALKRGSLVETRGGDAIAKRCGQGESEQCIDILLRAHRPYPGVALKQPSPAHDAHEMVGLEALVENLSDTSIYFSIRVDPEHAPPGTWRSEGAHLASKASAWVRVLFDVPQDGKPVSIDPAHIDQVLLFANELEASASVRVHELRWISNSERDVPRAIVAKKHKARPSALSLGSAIGLKLHDTAGCDASVAPEGLVVRLREVHASLRIALPHGVDFRDFPAAALRIRSTAGGPLRIQATLHSVHPEGRIDAATTLLPNADGDVVLPFQAWPIELGKHGDSRAPVLAALHSFISGNAHQKHTGFANDAIHAIDLRVRGASGDVLEVEHLRGVYLPVRHAKKNYGPPGPGPWNLTFADDFNGPALDEASWTPTMYWEGVLPWELQRYSRENVSVRDGHLVLQVEKRPGHANDNRRLPLRSYTSAAVTSYGKRTFRYGYVEARLKLPKARGLWPGFWTMPDRGATHSGTQRNKNERTTTADGGMEIDIFEHVTRSGPYRYDVAVHWDGYEQAHRTLGDAQRYAVPDSDGYIRAGLLWEEGLLRWYANGVEVASFRSTRVPNVPLMLLFTVQMGGMAGTEVDDAALPDALLVDSVKIWTRSTEGDRP